MESYFEKKKKKQKVITTIFLLPVVLAVIYLFFWKLLSFSKEDGPLFYYFLCVAYVAFNILALLFFKEYLGLKIPPKKTPEWILLEVQKINNLFEQVEDNFRREESKRVEKGNSICPNCGNNKKNVEKIRNTSGKISGDFSLGFGSVGGGIETTEVNHCSQCGHEWNKVKWSGCSEKAMDSFIYGIYDFFEEGKNWDSDLKKFSAKAVKIFLEKNNFYHKTKKLSKLSIRDLKKYTGK